MIVQSIRIKNANRNSFGKTLLKNNLLFSSSKELNTVGVIMEIKKIIAPKRADINNLIIADPLH